MCKQSVESCPVSGQKEKKRYGCLSSVSIVFVTLFHLRYFFQFPYVYICPGDMLTGNMISDYFLCIKMLQTMLVSLIRW